MIFKFLILSDEVDAFKREIKIDADATFMNLYNAIIGCTGFNKDEMASFVLCDDKWRKKQEITLVEMDTNSDEDSYIMEECVLSDFLEDEKQKLMFVFDFFNERALYIELSELIPGKHLKSASCTLSIGEPPLQIAEMEVAKVETVSLDTGETFFGDESFEMEELDRDGFEGLDEGPAEPEANDLY